MSNNKITFVVLAYNHENYIEECLQSIEQQSIKVYELIISDDASQDKTKNKIADFIKTSAIQNINFFNNKYNKGLISSLNACLNVASGDLILLQAGDDSSHPTRAEITKMRFSETECKVLYSSYHMMDNNSNIFKTINRSMKITDPTHFIIKGAAEPPFGMAFTQDFLTDLGSIKEDLKNEDDYIGMAAVVSGGLLVIPDILYKYRIHSRSLSSWNNMKIDSKLFLKYFLNNQSVRVDNLHAWQFLIENSLLKKTGSTIAIECERLIKKKINIKLCTMNLRERSLFTRIKILTSNYNAANIQDIIILVFGIAGVLSIRWVRLMFLRAK